MKNHVSEKNIFGSLEIQSTLDNSNSWGPEKTVRVISILSHGEFELWRRAVRVKGISSYRGEMLAEIRVKGRQVFRVIEEKCWQKFEL